MGTEAKPEKVEWQLVPTNPTIGMLDALGYGPDDASEGVRRYQLALLNAPRTEAVVAWQWTANGSDDWGRAYTSRTDFDDALVKAEHAGLKSIVERTLYTHHALKSATPDAGKGSI